MQGMFTIGFSRKKSDIAKVEAAYWESMRNPNEYIETIWTDGYEDLADGDPGKIMFRTNSSINVRLAGKLFPRLVESAPDAEAGCWWASLETERYYRTCMYSKAGSAEFKEFEDTIRTIGGAVKIYLCNPYYEEEVPVIQLLLELYHTPL